MYGLEHLKSTKVCALLDYGVVENLFVDENGCVKLPYSAKEILIGLPYEFELETLNLEAQGTLGIKKIINNIEVKIFNSREDFFIKNDNGVLSQNARSFESINNSNKLYDGNVEFCPLALPDKEVSVKIVQKYPLPLNILAISTTLNVQEVETQ